MSLAILPNGHHVFAGSTLGSLYKFDMRKFDSYVARVESSHQTSVNQIVCQHKPRVSCARTYVCVFACVCAIVCALVRVCLHVEKFN